MVKGSDSVQVPKWLVTLVGSLCVIAFAALARTVIDVAVIKSDRFTSDQAEAMRREIEMGEPTFKARERLRALEDRTGRLEGFHRN